MIAFTVPSVPVAQPRQRHSAAMVGGKLVSRNYLPARHPVNAFKAAVQLAFRQAYQGAPLDGPLYLGARFVMPRPKRLTKKRGENAREWCPCKPDVDNLTKSLKDALTGLAFGDDCQVVWADVRKVYAAASEPPGVLVILGAAPDVTTLMRMKETA
jgi:Holliday junction resolvase RusA-like endonuclease